MLFCQEVSKDAAVEKAKVSRSQRVELLRIADTLSPRIKKKFLAAMESLRSKANIKKVADALSTGNERALFAALGFNSIPAMLGPVTDEFIGGMMKSGVATATQAAAGYAGMKLQSRFDILNPKTIEFAGNYTFDLVRRIEVEQREVVRQIVSSVVNRGTPTAGAASLRRIMTGEELSTVAGERVVQAIGLDPRRAQALLNYRNMLESGNRSGALARDIGGRAERTVNAAMRDGTMTGDKIDALVESYRSRLMAQRAAAISHTESMRAVNMGGRAAWEQVFEQNPNIDRQKVTRHWVATSDNLTREAHREIVQFNPDGVGMDEPFHLPDGRTIMFPHDPDADADLTINCRCTVIVRLNEVPEAALPPILTGRAIV